MRTVCVYCGSSDEIPPSYMDAATKMGQTLAQHQCRLVFGGGGTGLMGALADAVLDQNGYVIGVIPEFFNTAALVHSGLSELQVVETMHVRKARMADLADGFIALPGGFGTVEELFEILTWSQIGLHRKPVGMLNVDGYYDPLLAFIEHAYEEGFLYTEHRRLLLSESTPQLLFDSMQAYQTPANLSRWVDRTTT